MATHIGPVRRGHGSSSTARPCRRVLDAPKRKAAQRFPRSPSPGLGVLVKRRCDFGAAGKCLVSALSANPDTKYTLRFAVYSTVYRTGSVRLRYGRETPPVAGATPGSRGSRGRGLLARGFLLAAGRALSATRTRACVSQPVTRRSTSAASWATRRSPRRWASTPVQHGRPRRRDGRAGRDGDTEAQGKQRDIATRLGAVLLSSPSSAPRC